MNNYSKEHQKYLRTLRLKTFSVSVCRWGILLVFLGLWELLAFLKAIDTFIMSCPSRIVLTIIDLLKNGNLLKHIGYTLGETIVSFVLSTCLGLLIAIILWSNSVIRKVLEPHLIVLNALPKIALGPIIIIWVGAGQQAIIVMAMLISIFVTIINILSGFLAVEHSKLMLFDTMNASKWQVLTKLVLPANIPTIINALKINVGLSWVGTIMGEYLVSRAGLGYLIIYGGQIFKLDLVMASTITLCALAGIMYFLVEFLEKLVAKKYNF